ncbi:hypothetical protein [Rhizobium sp. LC145]|uniref:hypothetical protein n=1 Tax=Rhizobium sp. LC145 TaxID=1120688 RepID=UPI00062A1562|nr:hypothetical protein [Rhizobium sp. LC145]KKX25332.1 hypothetical protein YH62_25650 [Rhizobium sp. LC145]TKT45355.1 hypothetical protein FDR95_25815 [Rhizobiaceae bacterium LC148]
MGEIKHNDLEESIRLAEIGEYLYNRSYSYGNGYDEPREFGIEWQWQQSKPNEFGQGALLAEAVKWHSDMAEDGLSTEATKLRASIEKNAKTLEHWRQEVGKLHSQIASHTSALAERDARIAELEAALKSAEDALFWSARQHHEYGNSRAQKATELSAHSARAALAREQADA